MSLPTLGTAAAEQFIALWQQTAGIIYQPWADVVPIIGSMMTCATIRDLRIRPHK